MSHWTHELRYLEAIRQTIVNAPEEALQLAQGPARGGLSQELAQKNLEILAENYCSFKKPSTLHDDPVVFKFSWEARSPFETDDEEESILTYSDKHYFHPWPSQ